MPIPIFIVHKGNNDYLKYCLYQARYYNPKSEIILIGDRINNKYPFVRHYHIGGYSFNANIIAKYFEQKNGIAHDPEKRVRFKNWFILRDFMRLHNYGDEFIYIDSDVLLFCDVTKEFEIFKNYSLTTGINGGMHCTFFNGHTILEELCDLTTGFFTKQNDKKILADNDIHRSTENMQESIDDIILIREYKNQNPSKVGDNSIVINNSTYEDNLNERQGYEFNDSIHLKNIYWKDGYPYGKQILGGKLIKFNAMHFAGPAKSFIHRYYTGKNLRIQKFFSEMYNKLGSSSGKK